jgi:exosome complex component RRP41
MALVDAGIPMLDYVCACSAGCIDKEPVLDLNNLEESADTPELTVAILPRTGKVTLLEVWFYVIEKCYTWDINE